MKKQRYIPKDPRLQLTYIDWVTIENSLCHRLEYYKDKRKKNPELISLPMTIKRCKDVLKLVDKIINNFD